MSRMLVRTIERRSGVGKMGVRMEGGGGGGWYRAT